MIKDFLAFVIIFCVLVVTIFLLAVGAMMFHYWKINPKEPELVVSDYKYLVEEFYEEDEREIMYIRRNQVPNASSPYHYRIDILDDETEFVLLYMDDGEEIKVKLVDHQVDD